MCVGEGVSPSSTEEPADTISRVLVGILPGSPKPRGRLRGWEEGGVGGGLSRRREGSEKGGARGAPLFQGLFKGFWLLISVSE